MQGWRASMEGKITRNSPKFPKIPQNSPKFPLKKKFEFILRRNILNFKTGISQFLVKKPKPKHKLKRAPILQVH